MKMYLFFYSFMVGLGVTLLQHQVSSRSFSIDYENNTFVKDGKPFRYISGSFHYPRVPSYLWKDRLLKMKAMGLNTFQTYVFWNVHNPSPGVYNFSGENDVILLLKLAGQLGFNVILRPGPYIDAEWDFGGLPSYLLKRKQNESAVLTRTMDPRYIQAVNNWFEVLLPKVKPLMYNNGGPIIIVQVENEYGFNFVCDMKYMIYLRDLFKRYLGNQVVLTTNNAVGMNNCIPPGVMPSLDFGPGVDASAAFADLRKHAPKGPLVNSEYYLGAYDSWGHRHNQYSPDFVILYLKKLLDMGVNVNMYLAVGGSTSGYMNGVYQHISGTKKTFAVVETSYNFDAPITEWGNLTDKFFALREFLKNYTHASPPIPDPEPIRNYGRVQMSFFATVLGSLPGFIVNAVYSNKPISMENMNQSYGFILYQSQNRLREYYKELLSIPGIRSRGYLLINQIPAGLLYWHNHVTTMSDFSLGIGQTFHIFVENFGRLKYGKHDFQYNNQGIISPVTIGNDTLNYWITYSLDFQKVAQSFSDEKTEFTKGDHHKLYVKETNEIPASIFYGVFTLNSSVPKSTFIDMSRWGKGQVFINGFNLGRYWSSKGPQRALYVPGGILKPNPQKNRIMLVELELANCHDEKDCYIDFIDYPILNGKIHSAA